MTFEWITNAGAETHEAGRKLAAMLRKSDVVALYGDLGSGKTVLTKGICEGLGVRELVTSPTFTLVQQYQAGFPVYHFDFYRLQTLEEIEMLDLDAYFDGDGLSIVEWADRGEPLLPEIRWNITFIRDPEDYLFPDRRRIKISAPADRQFEENAG